MSAYFIRSIEATYRAMHLSDAEITRHTLCALLSMHNPQHLYLLLDNAQDDIATQLEHTQAHIQENPTAHLEMAIATLLYVKQHANLIAGNKALGGAHQTRDDIIRNCNDLLTYLHYMHHSLTHYGEIYFQLGFAAVISSYQINTIILFTSLSILSVMNTPLLAIAALEIGYIAIAVVVNMQFFEWLFERIDAYSKYGQEELTSIQALSQTGYFSLNHKECLQNQLDQDSVVRSIVPNFYADNKEDASTKLIEASPLHSI